MKLWEELEQQPEYGLLTPEDRVAVHDEWRSSILSSLADEDPEAVDAAGVTRFVATERARNQALKTGKPFDPATAEKEYLREVADRTAAQKQALTDYDELEKARFALKDAAARRGVASAGDRGMPLDPRVAEILDQDRQEAQRKLDEIGSRLTPEMLQQVKEVREAKEGQRPTAMLGSDLYTDPSLLLDKDKYRAAVAESGASPEAKARAMADFAEKRKQFAENSLRTLRVAGESPIPGAQDFPTWEASQPEDVRRLSPEDKALQYMREMQKRGDIRKLTSAIGTGLVQGGTDIASQGLGVAAMVANSGKLAEKAAEVAEGAQTLEEVSKLEGDKQAFGAGNLGGAARLIPSAAATIAPAALTGGASLGVSAALAGAQTAGAQFPNTYTELRKQGMSEQDALNAARNSAIASGIVTAGLTAAFGKTGMEAALGAGAGGKELVKSRLVAAMKGVPKGAVAEIPEELLDEMASQVIEQRTIDPEKPVSQIIDEFAATAPDLAMQIALLGGAGGAVGGYRGSTTEAAQEQEFPAAGAPPDLSQRDRDNFAQGGVPIFDTEGNVTGYTAPRVAEATASTEDIRKAAEEAIKPGIPVEVEGVTIATINPESGWTPEDVLDFANSPEDMATLARNKIITLPEVVAPIEGVDPAITDEMNERVAASAALAPQTVEALKAAPAPEVQTEAAEPIETEGAEVAEASVTETPEEVKPAETLGVTPPPAPTLEAPEGAARNAEMLRQAAARAAGAEQGPRIGFLQSPSTAVTTTNETPSSTANAAGGSQGVQTEPAEGSIPTVTEDTVSILDTPSTPVTPQGEVPTTATEGQPMPGGSSEPEWTPTPGQPATANINGQKVVGTVGPSTGSGLVSFQYEWNGQTQKATVRPDRLSSPVASLVEPPRYQYTQEQNTRKMGKHFPSAPGVHANHDFRKSFASMAKDKSLSRIYRQIARVMSEMPAFANMDLHVVADENTRYAGEYSHSNGKSAIAVNLRQVGRGMVDALGTILHEALHHVTLAKVRDPQGAWENEVFNKLDTIREKVLEYAKEKGLYDRLDYELDTVEEFISALTNPNFQNFLASIPDSFSTGVSVGKFRSVLSEVFRLIAEWIKGEPVARGSTMEQYFTTVLATFETPHRVWDTGKLEALNAVQSGAAQATPESIRHAELEAKFNAGTITPEETAEAQRLVDERAKAAGGVKIWHGGNIEGFVIDTDRRERGAVSERRPGTFFGSTSKEVAKTYPGKTNSMFFFLKNPFRISTPALRPASWTGETAVKTSKGVTNRKSSLSIGEAIDRAKANGYDGVVYENIIDVGRNFAALTPPIANTVVAFDPNQIKSADPFTGVPLDQRFDEKSNDIRASRAEGRGYRSPTGMLAEAAQKARGETVGTKPQGLASMFNPQAKRPTTGERKLLDMPTRSVLTDAYREAVRGSSTQMAPLSTVYAQARLMQPGLTPEAFLAQVQEGYDNGTLLLEGAGSQQEAAQSGLALPGTPVGTAVRMMPAPQGTLKSKADDMDAEYMAAVEAGDMGTAQRMVDDAAKAAGYDRKLFHGTNATETVEGKSTSGSDEAIANLKALAKRVGLKDWNGVTSVYQRLADNGQMGVTQEDAANAKKWQAEAEGTYEPSREMLSFDVFSPPSGELELGVHLGNKGAAAMFGEVFPFFTKLGKPFRLPDLGTWNYQSVMRELRKRGVKISEAEYDAVFNANDNNAVLRGLLHGKGIESIVYRNEAEGEGDSFIAFNPNQIKSADPVTRDKTGNVIPLSQRFNPESPSILYAAPIDTTQSNEPDAGTGGGRDSASSAQNGGASERAAEVSPSGSSTNPASVLARLDAGREEAVSAAVAESDWGNYTPEQKTEALNSFIRSTYGAADYSSWAQLRDIGGLVLTRGGKGSASVRSSVGADGRLNLELTYDNTERSLPGVMGGIPAREMFAFSYDTAQEEIIHAADKIGAFQRWKDAGRPGTFVEFERDEAKATVTQLNQTRLSLQESDPAASQKIKEAMLASWNIYHADDQVPGINGLLNRLDQTKNDPALYLYELRRQLTQLKRQDFTTETGWQKFRRVLEKWITDAINSLRGVQDVFRSGMAGDLIQRQLADLDASLDGKPLPPVSRGTPKSVAEEGGEPPTIDIGGEAEPADGKGKQLYQKNPTAIGDTYISPADITLQEKKTQQETLDAARKIIGEEIAKNPNNTLAGRRAALNRFRLDTSIPPQVRAVGTGVIAQQADRMANLSEGTDQLLLDEMADEAAKLSGIMSSDLEAWRNLKADANLQIDKMAEEAGRTLNIFNVFRRLTPEGFLRRMTRKFNDAVREKVEQNFDVPAGEVEAEIMRLWKMMQEAGATARGESIAAALKAFMPRRVNTRKIIESLFPQAGIRDRMNKGGEALVRSFFQMMAGPRDQKGPLAEFDESIQSALSGMLRKVMEAKGLVAENQSSQATDIDKMVRAISADELRFDKIAAADEAMQKELDSIEDPERRAVLQQAWEEATAKMYTNIASDATVRRALNVELKGMNVDWTKMFDSNQKPTAIRAKAVDGVMAKIETLLTDPSDPTVRANLGMLRGEVEAAFDFIAANKRTEWLAQREAIEARRRVAEHRAAFMEALRNQGVAEQAINRISEKLAGPQRGKPDQNPVSALVGEHMKAPVADFVDKLVALEVDRATAESLDKAASTLRSEVAAAEKLKAAERAVAQLMKSLKPKPRAPREKIEKALKTLFTADTVGALDDQAFFDAFGEAFGMPPLSDEQQTRIKKLIREINSIPKGPARLDKQQDLDEELALWKGIAARDVLLSAWYANILSGFSTQGMGLLGNAFNFVPRSLFLMATNPRSAKAYLKGAFGEGLSTGLKEAAAAMKGRGLYKVSKHGDKSIIGALELLRKKGPSTLSEWIAYISSAGTEMRRVFRIMQAIDALAWNTAREGHAYLAAHRALLEQEKESGTKRSPEEFSRAFIDSLGGDVAQIEEDLRAARQALIDAGQVPSMLTVDRMAREARNLRRAASGVKAGNRFADRIVLQQDPEGSGKFISSLIDVFQKKRILGLPVGQLLIPFNRIVSNLFEQSLDYTPVGFVRAILGGHLSDAEIGWDGVKFKEGSQLFDQMERRERGMAAVTGMAAAAAIYALANAYKDEPDEDVPFMIYGWGPESKNKRAQMPKGWVPYSVKWGGTYIKFSEMPFGMMFAAAGSAMDAMRYKDMDKKTSTQRLAYILKTAAKGFLNQGVMSSLDTALETLMFDASEKKMADIPVNVVKGLMPAQGMLRDISTIMDPTKVSDGSLTSMLLRDIPFAKSWGTKPDLNVFGEPIKLDGYPITRRIVTHREPHAVADYLGRNELSIPGMEQTIEIGKYLPDKAKDRIQARAVELGAMENGLFTPEQNYAFKKRAGELTKAAVQEIMKKTPKVANDEQRKQVQDNINKAVGIARNRAMLEAVPVK